MKVLADAGAPLLLSPGRGPFIIPGFGMIQEMRLYLRAGLKPNQVLEAATRSAAEYFGEADEWGTIGVGKRADLVLLDGNPLDSIDQMENISGVMLRGRWYSKDVIKQTLDGIVAKNLSRAK